MTVSHCEEIEMFFKRFPDVPPVVIVKEELLRLGWRFSPKALEASKGCRLKSYRLFSYDATDMQSMEQRESFNVPEDIIIHGGPYGLSRSYISTTLFPDSPYLLDVKNDKLVIAENGNIIAEVSYPKAPPYYERKFPDGTHYSQVVPMTADHRAFITAFRQCQFWGADEECLFCDINENARQLHRLAKSQTGDKTRFTLPDPIKKTEMVTEALKAMVEEKDPNYRLISYIVTGGAILKSLTDMTEDKFYLRYIKTIKECMGNRIPCLLQTVAKEKDVLREYKEAGVNVHHANIEVWDPDLFASLCPGKEKLIGRDEWIGRVIDSVDIFGEGNVTPNFVSGVEMCKPYGFESVDKAVKSTAEGIEYLMSHGVVLRLNTWRREWGSALRGNPPIPLEFYVRNDLTWYETWKKYNLPGPSGQGPVGPGRSLVQNSAYLEVGF